MTSNSSFVLIVRVSLLEPDRTGTFAIFSFRDITGVLRVDSTKETAEYQVTLDSGEQEPGIALASIKSVRFDQNSGSNLIIFTDLLFSDETVEARAHIELFQAVKPPTRWPINQQNDQEMRTLTIGGSKSNEKGEAELLNVLVLFDAERKGSNISVFGLRNSTYRKTMDVGDSDFDWQFFCQKGEIFYKENKFQRAQTAQIPFGFREMKETCNTTSQFLPFGTNYSEISQEDLEVCSKNQNTMEELPFKILFSRLTVKEQARRFRSLFDKGNERVLEMKNAQGSNNTITCDMSSSIKTQDLNIFYNSSDGRLYQSSRVLKLSFNIESTSNTSILFIFVNGELYQKSGLGSSEHNEFLLEIDVKSKEIQELDSAVFLEIMCFDSNSETKGSIAMGDLDGALESPSTGPPSELKTSCNKNDSFIFEEGNFETISLCGELKNSCGEPETISTGQIFANIESEEGSFCSVFNMSIDQSRRVEKGGSVFCRSEDGMSFRECPSNDCLGVPGRHYSPGSNECQCPKFSREQSDFSCECFDGYAYTQSQNGKCKRCNRGCFCNSDDACLGCLGFNGSSSAEIVGKDSERFCQCDPFICYSKDGYFSDENRLDCQCCQIGEYFHKDSNGSFSCEPAFMNIVFLGNNLEGLSNDNQNQSAFWKINSPWKVNNPELMDKMTMFKDLRCFNYLGGNNEISFKNVTSSYYIEKSVVEFNGDQILRLKFTHFGNIEIKCDIEIGLAPFEEYQQFRLSKYIPQNRILFEKGLIYLQKSKGETPYDEVALEKVTQGTEVMKGAIGIQSLILALTGALSLIWNSLDLMQLIDCMKYLDINFPSNINEFFNTLDIYNFEFAQDQFLPCKYGIGDLGYSDESPRIDYLILNCNDLKAQNPTPGNFIGDDKTGNFLINMTNIWLICLLVIILEGTLKVLLMLPLSPESKVRSWFQNTRSKLGIPFYFRLFLEADLVIAMLCSLDIRFFSFSSHSGSDWQDYFDYSGLVISILFFCGCFALPFFFCRLCMKVFEASHSAPDESLVEKYGDLVDFLKPRDHLVKKYSFISCARRISVGFIIGFLNPWPTFSLALLISWSLFMFCFIGYYRPYKKISLYILNILNEFLILLVYCCFLYLSLSTKMNKYMEGTQIIKVGWWALGIINMALGIQGVIFVFELISPIYSGISQFIRKMRRKMDKKRAGEPVKEAEIEMTENFVQGDSDDDGEDDSEEEDGQEQETNKGKSGEEAERSQEMSEESETNTKEASVEFVLKIEEENQENAEKFERVELESLKDSEAKEDHQNSEDSLKVNDFQEFAEGFYSPRSSDLVESPKNAEIKDKGEPDPIINGEPQNESLRTIESPKEAEKSPTEKSPKEAEKSPRNRKKRSPRSPRIMEKRAVNNFSLEELMPSPSNQTSPGTPKQKEIVPSSIQNQNGSFQVQKRKVSHEEMLKEKVQSLKKVEEEKKKTFLKKAQEAKSTLLSDLIRFYNKD